MNNTIRADIKFSKHAERAHEPAIVGMMVKALSDPKVISLAAGFVDNAILPGDLIKKALLHLDAQPGVPMHLQYGTNQGRTLLLEETAKLLGGYLNEKAEHFSSKDIFIANGSQQALYLAMQVLCNPGDIVLVEGPSYFVFLEMLQEMGIEAISMPMKPTGGIDLERMDAFLGELQEDGRLERVKALYMVSYYANPSSHTVSLEEKVGLAELLDARGFHWPILEDAAYREICFKGYSPVPSVFSLEAYDPFPKLYLGTYSKPLSPGLKLGYGVCSHKEWLAKMLNIKAHQDFGSSNFAQALLETILNQGWYVEWLKGLHQHYSKKVACFERVVAEQGLRELGWHWEEPQGGFMVWLRGPEHIDTSGDSKFSEACLENGVFYVPGDLCFAERAPKNCIRLSIGTLDESRLEEGLKRLIKTMREFA